jgi:plasmid stability protein
MGKMVQIRNVPEGIHRTLKARAALAGLSLSDFLLRELRQVAERPSPEELRRRLSARRPIQADVSTAAAVREERDRR